MRGKKREPEPWEHVRMRVCVTCGERKPWAEFAAHRWSDDGRLLTVYPHCRVCVAERARERYQANPKRGRQKKNEWYAKNAERVQAAARQSRLEETSAEREIRLAKARIIRERFRERHREQLRKSGNEWARRKRKQVERDRKGYGELLPAEPFYEWLDGRRETAGEIAKIAGVSARRLNAVLTGENKRISLDTVDRCLLAFGEHIDDLYPYEEAA